MQTHESEVNPGEHGLARLPETGWLFFGDVECPLHDGLHRVLLTGMPSRISNHDGSVGSFLAWKCP